MPKPRPTRINEKYCLRQQCRHSKYKLDPIELGYPVRRSADGRGACRAPEMVIDHQPLYWLARSFTAVGGDLCYHTVALAATRTAA
jgi:hypothetical protein